MQTANVKTSPPDLFMLFARQKDGEIHFLFVFTRHIYVIYTADLGDTADGDTETLSFFTLRGFAHSKERGTYFNFSNAL